MPNRRCVICDCYISFLVERNNSIGACNDCYLETLKKVYDNLPEVHDEYNAYIEALEKEVERLKELAMTQ